MPEAEQIMHFDKTGNTSAAWVLAADQVQAAARILKGHRDQFDPTSLKVGANIPDEGKILFPELMLSGFAVECLLKALWLKNGNALAKNGKYLKVKGAANHNLLQLADAVGFHLDANARDVLKRLSIIMTSGGRYPIPIDWSARRIQKLNGGGEGCPEYWQYPTNDQILGDVIATLEKELNV